MPRPTDHNAIVKGRVVATKKPNTGTKPKTPQSRLRKPGAPKRKARDTDREFAAELVRRYRARDPFVFDKDSERGGIQIPVDKDLLIDALLAFAEDGTFDRFRREELRLDNPKVDTGMLVVAVILKRYPRTFVDIRDGVVIFKRTKGMKVTDAIGQVAGEYGVTEDIVKNALYPRRKHKKPPT